MDEVQEAAVLEQEITALGASPTARQLMDVFQGYSDSAVQIALKRTGGGGAPGGGQPQVYRQTLVPADFVGRVDVGLGISSVELEVDVQPEDVIFAAYRQNDSPGFEGGCAFQQVYFYTPGASTADVNSGDAGLPDMTWAEGTFVRLSSVVGVVLAEVSEGTALYAVYDGTEVPASGEDTIVVIVFKA